MVCDKCGPSREQGYSFCPNCGNPLKEGCLYCAQYERDGYEFCGKCGRHLQPRGEMESSGNGGTNPLKMGVLASVPFILIAMLVEMGAMLFYSGEGMSWVSENGTRLFLLLPMIVKSGLICGTGAQAIFIFIIIALIASAGLVLYQSLPSMRQGRNNVSDVERTPLYSISMLFGSTIILELVIMALMALSGHGMKVPDWISDMSLGETIFEMAEAAVMEEIAARLVIIGLPMAVLALCYGRKDFPRYLLGGFGMSRVAVALLIASALVFAYAHAGSWGFEKVLPTVVGGLAMGWLYIEHGIHASIMFHFLTDYMSVLTSLNEVMSAAWLLIILVAGIVCVGEVLRRTYVGVRSVKELPASGFEPGSDGKE